MKREIYTALIGLCLISGCASKPKSDAMSAPPSADALEQIRTAYKTTFPNARIGRVTVVLDDAPYAMVSDLDTAGLHERDVVTFLDSNQQVVAHGEVVKVDSTNVAVQFDAGMRRPQVGDAAIKF